MKEEIENLFPRLAGANYQITSSEDEAYNCIAWAAGVTGPWWWPFGDVRKTYWPAEAPREETVEAFRAAFEALNYAACGLSDPEPGHEKIALFADATGCPTHAARQLASGRWTSKLGMLEDIEHDLRDLEGTEYGTVALVMKRPVPSKVSDQDSGG